MGIVFLAISFGQLQAQDPHFSQFYLSPLQLNPALTGVMNEDIRASLLHRSQWRTVSAPFRTTAVSADFRGFKEYLDRDIFGLGVVVMSDKAGTADLRTTQVQLSAAYSRALNYEGNQFLSLGVQVGHVNQRVDPNKLLFASQFDGGALNPGIPSGEDIPNTALHYIDFSVGAAWSYRYNEHTSFYAGISLAHLNEPNVSFFEDEEEFLYQRRTLYGGSEFRINSLLSMIMRGVVLSQGPATEVSVASLLKFNFSNVNGADDATAFYVGTMHRWRDAQTVILRFDYGPVGLSMGYDVNFSSLRRASEGYGGMEIALLYRSAFSQSYRRSVPVRCPSF